MQDTVSIIIADDHPLFRDALANAIDCFACEKSIRLATNFSNTEEIIKQFGLPDILLLDLNMPGNNGLFGLAGFRIKFPSLPIVVISATEDPSIIRRSIMLGADGYITKNSSADTIRRALEQVIAGEIFLPNGIDLATNTDDEERNLLDCILRLTSQQYRVLGQIGKGMLNKQIAHELNISEATVKAHVSAVLLKLGLNNRTQVVIALDEFLNPAATYI